MGQRHLIAAIFLASLWLSVQAVWVAPLTAVVVAPVVLQNVAPTIDYAGRVQAMQSVALIAWDQGFVERIDFAESGLVRAGRPCSC